MVRSVPVAVVVFVVGVIFCLAEPVVAFVTTAGLDDSWTLTSSSSSRLYASQSQGSGGVNYTPNLYAAVHRKEREMDALKREHQSTSSPLRIAMSYVQETEPPLRMARALRRVYEDPENPANPDYVGTKDENNEATATATATPTPDLSMRRGCVVVDVKRRSYGGEHLCDFTSAGQVAAAMAQLGADAVMINVDHGLYGGDPAELREAVKAVRAVNPRTAVIMKDLVVDEIQLGVAKDAGCDGVLLIAGVLGEALGNFLDLCSVIGLEALVECHTYDEVQSALELLAQNVLVNNRDRLDFNYLHEEQACKLAGLFPGSGGPIVSLAGGGIQSIEDAKRHLAAGYDGVVLGRCLMGNVNAPSIIASVRDKVMLPVEFSGWGLDDVEFDMQGNVIDN